MSRMLDETIYRSVVAIEGT